MNAKEILKIISKQWCNFEDLMKLTELGRNSAFELKKQIVNELYKQNYHLPKKLLPMNKVVEYLKIDITYLRKITKEGEK